jgi:peptidoglycan/LPS O-acetylase OafA/YrhL
MNPLLGRVRRGSHPDGSRIPELDGLRAIAVVPVIALHFGANVNGAAGVTVFFALSGFIITTLLLTEHRRRGSVDLRLFYLRRFRRLLPAATAVVVATVVAGRALNKPPITRDAVAALTYWANFDRFTSHYSYGHTVYAPLEHFWSLAIEEQFYIVLPLLCIVLLPLGRRVLATVATVAMVASAMFAFVHRNSPQYYFHSLARVCELLAGVVLAVVLPTMMRFVGARRAAIVGYLALVGLIAVFAQAVTPQPILIALMTCLVIAGRPRLLAASPLVLIGTYSYGLYLWHPLTEIVSDRLGVRIALTLIFTFLSYHLIEFPIRRSLPTRTAIYAMGVLSLTAIIVVALPQAPTRITFVEAAPVIAAAPSKPMITITGPTTTSERSTTTTERRSSNMNIPATTIPATTNRSSTISPTTISPTTISPTTISPTTISPTTISPTTISPAHPLRISGAGDSTQMFTDPAWEAFAAAYPDLVTWVQPPAEIVPWTSGADGWIGKEAANIGLSLPTDGPQGGLDRQGCPMIYDLPIRAVDTFDFAPSAGLHSAMPVSSCDWHLWIPVALAQMHLDVLVVSWSVTDMWQFKMPNGHRGVVGDPAFDALLNKRRAEFEAMAAQYGTHVLWTTYEPLSTDAVPLRWAQPQTADLLAAVLLQRPCVSDLRSVIRSDPTFHWYQDGYHFTAAGAARAVSTLVPDVIKCWQQ